MEETNLDRNTSNAESKWIIQFWCNEAVDQVANVGCTCACASKWFMFTPSQDRRGHLKAPKFGQYCSQISEFYSSFSQLNVCRHRDYRGLYFAAWIDILFNEKEFLLYSRQQTTPVNYSFVHQTKNASDCCQMSIFQNSKKKMLSK